MTTTRFTSPGTITKGLDVQRLFENLILIVILSACTAPAPPATVSVPAAAVPLTATLTAPISAAPSATPPANATVAPTPGVAATGLPAAPPTQPAPGTPGGPSQLGKLAFVRDGAIWVMDLPDGTPRPLTRGSHDQEPQWSASGRWLAYRGNGTLWLARDDGSQAHAAGSSYPQGRRLWAPAADELLCFTAGGGLGIVQADKPGIRELVPPTNGRRGDGISSAAWSPDGQALAYARVDTLVEAGQPAGQVASLRRINADGTGDRELLNLGRPSTDGLIAAGWSPDGARILYRVVPYFSGSFLADGTAIWSIPAGGGTPVQIGKNLSALPRTDGVLDYADFLAWAPSANAAGGDLAATFGFYRGAWTNKRIGVAGVQTGAVRLLSPEGMAATSAAWSPDGRALAYSAMPDTGDLVGGDTARQGLMARRIYVANTQGDPQPRQLAADPAYRDELPLWSADGQEILFARLDQQSRASLWLVPAAGGEPRRVVPDLPLDPQTSWFGYYGHLDWQDQFDWWRGAPTRRALATSTATGASASLGASAEAGFPLAEGTSWTYAYAEYQPDAAHPTQTITATYRLTETVVGTEIITPYFVAHVQREVSAVAIPPGWTDSGSPGPGEFWYLVAGQQVYESAQAVDLTRIQTETLALAYDLPLAVGKSWCPLSILKGEPIPNCAVAGQRTVIGQGSYETPAGRFADCYQVTEVYLSGGVRRWLCNGLGVVAEQYDHNGTRFGFRQTLIGYSPGSRQ